MTTHPPLRILTQDSRRLQAAATAGLLNRYLLPKVALTVISIASLAGVFLTMTTHAAPPAWALVRWLHLTALGVLAGGAMWWGFFWRAPEHEEPLSVAQLLVAQERRFRVIGAAAWLLTAVTAFQLLWFYQWAVVQGILALWLLNSIGLAIALAGTAWLLWPQPVEAWAFHTGRARLAWAALTLTLALTALLDARLTFPARPSAWALRPVHMVAFGLWFGGALWNIFIAVPAAQETLAIPVVVAAAEQLERFRRVVRVILPTLILTGLLQALPYSGHSLTGLAFSPFGQLILLKLGLVIALVIIFISCPLWRACSPIRGMCDLEELQSPAAALPQPSRRIDNRGKACAGFVHIQRELDSMRPGEVLELLSTDRISWWELPVWLEKHGHTLVTREQSGRLWWKTYRFLIQKS